VSIGQLIYKVEIGRRLAGMVISNAKLFPFKVRKVVPKFGITHFLNTVLIWYQRKQDLGAIALQISTNDSVRT
jgi:hypothetical protein